MSNFGVIYVGTNLVNGKRYIGQTIQKPEIRFREHFKSAKTGAVHPFYSAIRKYGKDNFVFEVIWGCPDLASLNATEIGMIELLGTLHPAGYNLRNGGGNGRHADSTRALMSKTHRARFELPGVRDRYSRAAVKREADPELRARRAEMNANPEHRARHALAMEKVRADEEVQERRRASIRRAYQDPAKRIAQSERSTALWNDQEHRERRLQSLSWSDRIWINNGSKNARIRSSDPIPDGWALGRYLTDAQRTQISESIRSASSRPEVKVRMRAASKAAQNRPEVIEKKSKVTKEYWINNPGRRWITNGVECRRTIEQPPDGWWFGKTYGRRIVTATYGFVRRSRVPA